MTNLGPIGAATGSGDVATAAELEELGYDTLWLPGGQENNLARVADVVRATSGITVATGILSVDQVPAAEVARTYATLAETHPGRFVPGLGGAHGAKPLATLRAYLDELDPVVPASARILSALGPKMLQLARDRAFAAYPFLVTPDYVASARELVGPDTRLAVLLSVVAEADPVPAREAVRGGSLRFLAGIPGYAANFRRMGFTAGEIAGLADRLVDGVTVWGDFDTVVGRLREYRAAGADQLVIQLDGLPREWWAGLATALR
ncbi:TIGR03620 family F420-dependent LLM class oxidoreductase [Amycolatopsis acidiphila]|uniref:TIGR03620 family F420-dependent LLM class oxidoreductase n=1 Tax=Amycolatopsis acidiphila TaxID=715473 RepID=A0A558AG87_9PSEU|nr:TIGR03620 family F420-dependent LLM class oxidoreductase [Amycolatopsis acidiphila]TVT23279.1 TIGR03620 family F420-dependent LLM class oxidoreductase [Amycolatopsis acidiphila]UIJ56502.1 TIGR03620 family F420-dependent LLM class oxidoreductase [Amycolatopsis acidiphila]GHG66926.1 LLM class F420-dependent oxidoreductase [Amycolatopsis acidiphila]